MKDNWPTILYFGNDWSADNRTSSHHIARRLVRDHRVIYVESPGLRSPKGTGRDLLKIFKKIGKLFEGVRPIDERSYVYSLFQIPFHRFSFIRKLNEKIMVWQLKRICKKFNIERPILWFVLPHLAPILNKMNESLKVYYCIDDYSELPGVNKEMITAMDRKMTEECDLVFVSAKPLLEKKKEFKDKVILSRHGVDFEHFHQVYKSKLKMPDDVAHFKGSVIGFFGLVENWVDLSLIEYAARAKPEWNFLIIGRVAIEENPCEGLRNVHFIGPRTYEELPNYASVFDVATIPCVCNELIRNFNPLKLREYLAMGLPVVSTRFPEIDDFLDVVEVVDNKEEFLSKLEFVLKNDNDEKAKLRIEKVKPLSWESRFQTVCGLVQEKLK